MCLKHCIDAAGFQAAIWKPLIKCGQQSLEVFAVGIYLAFIGYFIPKTTSDGIVAQLLVGTAGIAIMTGVAYYLSWSKRVEKAAHAQAHASAVSRPSASSGRQFAGPPGRLKARLPDRNLA